ncbi:MAG: VOC family protein [Chloroflexota bacterium]
MLGDVIELTIVVKDLDAAINDFERLFSLKVHYKKESKQFGFKNAVLPLGKGHIELLQPVDPSSAAARFLKNRGEGVYLVGFDVKDVSSSVRKLREKGASVTETDSEFHPGEKIAWVHPRDAHGVMVELRQPEKYN